MNKTLIFKSQKKLVEVVNSYEDDDKDTDEFKDNLKNYHTYFINLFFSHLNQLQSKKTLFFYHIS